MLKKLIHYIILIFFVSAAAVPVSAQDSGAMPVPSEVFDAAAPEIMEQINAMDGVSSGIDCTPICGNPTCCIAFTISVPASAVPTAMAQNADPEATMLCEYSCGGHCPGGGGCCATWSFENLPTE